MAGSAAIPDTRKALHFLLYGSMIGGVVLAFAGIRAWGEKLTAPAPSAGTIYGSPAGQVDVNTLLHVLLALALVVTTARLLGTLFRIAHQPPVIGEILAGILLGPSLLGRFAPVVWQRLVPAAVAPFLNVISQVGVILYMFLVGLELDPGLMRQRGQATVAISHASITTPFLMGSLLALLLYPIFSNSKVPFTNFALFLGVSMSVTAFPVLARILTDRRIHKTRMGTVALTCAAVDDITAWCLLAFVVSVARAKCRRDADGAFGCELSHRNACDRASRNGGGVEDVWQPGRPDARFDGGSLRCAARVSLRHRIDRDSRNFWGFCARRGHPA
jgi:Sodium/hydrogen exchanger family